MGLTPVYIEYKLKSQIISIASISEGIMETTKWTDFTGWGFLPGIKSCSKTKETENGVGTIFSVQNLDGSTHKEEILEWDTKNKIVILMYDFSKPLASFADHFIETWEMQSIEGITHIKRSFYLYPKNILGKILLQIIAPFFKQAVKKHFRTMESSSLI